MFDILELVKDYPNITIFRHTSADADAMGSQFGLKTYLENVYPDKKIFALGNDLGSCAKNFPAIDEISDDIIANSIAIILDCANHERIDDQRYALAKDIIKIDHHPLVDSYASKEYVDTKAAATCQILVELFKDKTYVTQECATYLYLGLIADTLNFTTTNTSAKSLQAASFLIECGVNPAEIKKMQGGISINEFKLINLIRNNVIIDGNIAYSIIDIKEYETLGLTYNTAKEKIYALAGVDEFEIWAIFTEFEAGIYNGSIRSQKVKINDIANKYNGGGHPNASGVKGLTLKTIPDIIKDLKTLL